MSRYNDGLRNSCCGTDYNWCGCEDIRMIDYEDLSIAHDMAVDLNLNLTLHVDIIGGKHTFKSHLHDPQTGFGNMYSNIDRLLEELKERLRPKAKYQIGQTVWRLNDEYEPQSFIITDIDHDSEEMYLDDNQGWWVEEQLYSSKAILIEQQIIYWTKRQMKLKDTTVHVKDFDKSTGLKPTILEQLARIYVKE